MYTPGVSSTARILVAITTHYVPARLRFLSQILRVFTTYRVEDLHICILTTANAEQKDPLERLARESLAGTSFEVMTYRLDDNWDLPWCHKPLITEEFLGNNHKNYSHFIYLEDDMAIDFQAFSYFVRDRERLRSSGLIPSFLRTEYNDELKGLVCLDIPTPFDLNQQARLSFDDVIYINAPNAYCACYILDRELGEEYSQSASFDRTRSETVHHWGQAERAAMGLCFENVPEGFWSRWAIPVSRRTGMVATEAWIPHLENKYTNQESNYAKTRMDSLITGVPAVIG